MARKKRKQYDDKFRAGAVVMLQAQGYPDTKGALAKVASHLGVPAMTISRWFRAAQNPPPNELVTEKKEELADVFEKVARLYLNQAVIPDEVTNTGGKDAVMTAAIAVDKMRLLRGLPTEIVSILPDVVTAIQSMNQDPVEVFRRIIERAAQRQDAG